MKKIVLVSAVFVAAFLGWYVAPAQAQASRTWVSGVGDDANPCSRTAPCKTFAGAISKTAAFGEINCLDPGGFGGVTITKSIMIRCNYTEGGVLVSGTNAIVVNAAATDKVYLEGLDIMGFNTSLNGIRFLAGAALHVKGCVIREFNSASAGFGIDFAPGGASELYVTDTNISDNGFASGGGGINVKPTGSGSAAVQVERVQVANNFNGIIANGNGSTGGIKVTVVDSSSSGNSGQGVIATTPVGGAAVKVMVNRLTAVNNGTGVQADGAGAGVLIGSSNIKGNTTGVAATNGGTLGSYKNNQINDNTSDGTPIGQVLLN
jgi:hypothetical protein